MQKARPSKGTPKAVGGGRQSGQFRVPQLTAQQLRAQQQQEEEDAGMDALDDALIFDDEEGGTRIGDIYIPPPVPPHCSMESVGPYLRDSDEPYKLTETNRSLGLVVCRGTALVLICPQDGVESIANPFITQ